MQFELNGNTYFADKIPAMKQFHIVRRLAPLLAGMAPTLDAIKMQTLASANAADIIPNLAAALSKVSDADAEFVIYGLMSSVKKKEPRGGGWSPIIVSDRLQFQDMTMPEMIQIAAKSAQHNLKDFLSALPQSLTSADPTQNPQ